MVVFASMVVVFFMKPIPCDIKNTVKQVADIVGLEEMWLGSDVHFSAMTHLFEVFLGKSLWRQSLTGTAEQRAPATIARFRYFP